MACMLMFDATKSVVWFGQKEIFWRTFPNHHCVVRKARLSVVSFLDSRCPATRWKFILTSSPLRPEHKHNAWSMVIIYICGEIRLGVVFIIHVLYHVLDSEESKGWVGDWIILGHKGLNFWDNRSTTEASGPAVSGCNSCHWHSEVATIQATQLLRY